MSSRRRPRLALAVGSGLLAAGLASSTASAAPPTPVDFTSSETLSSPPLGSLSAVSGLDCATGSPVTTPTVTQADRGPNINFAGTKLIDCGHGSTLTLSFNASTSCGESTIDGRWKIESGTGTFEGAKGSGALVGTYVGGGGTACDNTGVNDNYVGTIKT